MFSALKYAFSISLSIPLRTTRVVCMALSNVENVSLKSRTSMLFFCGNVWRTLRNIAKFSFKKLLNF